MSESERHTWSCCILIVACLLASGSGQRSQQEPSRTPAGAEQATQPADAAGKSHAQGDLAVRIELDGRDDPRTINFDESFVVVLVNNSDRAIKMRHHDRTSGDSPRPA